MNTMNDLVLWFYVEDDFLITLCRIIVFVFVLQFVTGIAYILRGGVNGCQ